MSQPQSSQAASSSSAGPAGLGLMSSMSPECTPLKHRYDACFHSWLVDYLALRSPADAPAAAAQPKDSSSSSMWGRGKKEEAPVHVQDEAAKRKSLKERLDGECGGMWEEYRKCVTRAVSANNLDGLIAEARAHNPFPFPHERAPGEVPSEPFPFASAPGAKGPA